MCVCTPFSNQPRILQTEIHQSLQYETNTFLDKWFKLMIKILKMYEAKVGHINLKKHDVTEES